MATANDSPVPSLPEPAAALARRGRARLAFRRSRAFVLRWVATLGTLVLFAVLAPFLRGAPEGALRARLDALVADTLRSADRLRAAQSAVTSAESLLAAARVPAPSPVAAPVTRPEPARGADPLVASLVERITAARRSGAVADYLALAAHESVRGGPRMRALADSMRTLEGLAGAPGGSPGERAAQVARLGRTIVAIAENRRRELESARAGLPPVASAAAPIAPAVPDAVAPDTTELATALVAARAGLATAQRDHDSIAQVLADAARARGAARDGGAAWFPAIALLALLVLGPAVRLTYAYRAEVAAPTLADAAEAERLSGLRVLTVVRETPPTGPARFKPSGVDPFRMLYLSLTASGTRARTTMVTGGDLDVAAIVGARLAIAAAADHRNTLVVDLDPVRIALSRTFRERAEPGVSDVLATAFTWREVARPVGSSDGLPITLLPAGTERDDLASGEQRTRILEDFARLRTAHEFTIAIAPRTAVPDAATLVPGSPVVLTAVVGETTLEEFLRDVRALRDGGHRVHGLVLWDTPKPELPTRAELAAELSRRKGRTPGGSFEAVQRVIGRHNRDSNRT